MEKNIENEMETGIKGIPMDPSIQKKSLHWALKSVNIGLFGSLGKSSISSENFQKPRVPSECPTHEEHRKLGGIGGAPPIFGNCRVSYLPCPTCSFCSLILSREYKGISSLHNPYPSNSLNSWYLH